MNETNKDQIADFFADVFGISEADFIKMGDAPDHPPTMTGPDVSRMPGVMRLHNQPEFAADAPWRLEPDQDTLPLVFYIRDADTESSADGPWQIDMLKVEQKNTDFDLTKKLKRYDDQKTNDVIVEFDATQLTNNSFEVFNMLSMMLSDSGQVGEMEFDIFKLKIKKLEDKSKNLINISDEWYQSKLK